MTNRTAKPENMSWVVPYLIVADAGAASKFYHDNFGFEILSTAKDDDGKVMHAELKYKDIVIMCGNSDFSNTATKTPAQSGVASSLVLYIYHENVDALHTALNSKGIRVDTPPEDQFWGDRMLSLTDQDGHQWSFATHIAEHEHREQKPG